MGSFVRVCVRGLDFGGEYGVIGVCVCVRGLDFGREYGVIVFYQKL